ncbi:MAG: apolipoprotein N-acyltransferase [Deltaproteobacteria bacterium]
MGPRTVDPPAGRAGGGATSLRLAVSALLFGLSYPLGMPGYGVPFLPFVSLVPFLFLVTAARSGRQAARWGMVAGTLAHMPLFYWIAWTVAVPGNLGWIAGGTAALLVSAYVGAYVSATAGLLARVRIRFGEWGLFALPPAWVALEYARSTLMTGFPWMLFGYSLSEDRFLRQAADLAGIEGIGFLLATINLLLHVGATRFNKGERGRGILSAAGALALIGFLFSYGACRFHEIGVEPGGPGLIVGIAQGGIDQSLKWDPAYQRETLAIYAALTAEAKARGAEVVVWPETAVPFFYGWEPELNPLVERAAAESGVPVLFGAPWFDPSAGGRYYNSVFQLDRHGVPRGRYDKRHLVPFGEYIPLRNLLFFMEKLTVGEEDFSSGTGPSLFTVQGTRVGASVCYEAIFPSILREAAREGAGWFVNVTNDAWFGDTVAPRQHLAMARMRAVEFRRPLVRAANSGISAVFDARGETVAEIGLFRREAVTGRIRTGNRETIYAKMGELFAMSCTIITLFVLAATMNRRRGSASA